MFRSAFQMDGSGDPQFHASLYATLWHFIHRSAPPKLLCGAYVFSSSRSGGLALIAGLLEPKAIRSLLFCRYGYGPV